MEPLEILLGKADLTNLLTLGYLYIRAPDGNIYKVVLEDWNKVKA